MKTFSEATQVLDNILVIVSSFDVFFIVEANFNLSFLSGYQDSMEIATPYRCIRIAWS